MCELRFEVSSSHIFLYNYPTWHSIRVDDTGHATTYIQSPHLQCLNSINHHGVVTLVNCSKILTVWPHHYHESEESPTIIKFQPPTLPGLTSPSQSPMPSSTTTTAYELKWTRLARQSHGRQRRPTNSKRNETITDEPEDEEDSSKSDGIPLASSLPYTPLPTTSLSS